jgi:O-antigen/teichoic acid export membrane protein
MLDIHLALLIPCVVVVLTMAKPLISVICGHQYNEAIPILQMLSLVVLARGLTSALSPYIMATGKYRFLSKVQIIESVVFISAVIIGTHYYGGSGAAMGAGFGYLVPAGIRLLFVCRNSSLSVSNVLEKIVKLSFCMLPWVAIRILFIDRLVLNSFNELCLLLIILPFIYFPSCYILQRRVFNNFKDVALFFFGYLKKKLA